MLLRPGHSKPRKGHRFESPTDAANWSSLLGAHSAYHALFGSFVHWPCVPQLARSNQDTRIPFNCASSPLELFACVTSAYHLLEYPGLS